MTPVTTPAAPTASAAVETFPMGKDAVKTEWTFQLPGAKAVGEYRLGVLARSKDAAAPSNTVSVSYIDRTKVPDLHVLVVGINEYDDQTLKLDFAAKDARDLAAAFKAR